METVRHIINDQGSWWQPEHPDEAAIPALLAERGVEWTDLSGWHRLDEHEIVARRAPRARPHQGRPARRDGARLAGSAADRSQAEPEEPTGDDRVDRVDSRRPRRRASSSGRFRSGRMTRATWSRRSCGISRRYGAAGRGSSAIGVHSPMSTCCTCTAGRTTSSRSGSRASGPIAGRGSTRSTCASTAGACDLARRRATSPTSRRTTKTSLQRSRRWAAQPDGTASARRLVLMGHSTGGLTLSLWADRHPDAAAALILNSPWLEFQLSGVDAGRHGADRGVPRPDASAQRRAAGRSRLLHARPGGGRRPDDPMDINLEWRRPQTMAVHAGWLNAILAGHARVATGLSIPVAGVRAALDERLRCRPDGPRS